MYHCHFSILYNELPFLKQKLPFLYKHFDQIIFYDLNINTLNFSDDGSHEYIKDFPDPEHKIILIEQTNLSNIYNFHGDSFGQKQQMFAIGSLCIKPHINVFWCTDLDEFFDYNLIKNIECLYQETNSNTFLIPHLIYYYNENFILEGENKSGLSRLPYARIMRHNPRFIYGHCSNGPEPILQYNENFIHHFAFVGNKRMKFKSTLYGKQDWYKKEFIKFNPEKFKEYELIKSKYKIPEYIDIKQLLSELNEQ